MNNLFKKLWAVFAVSAVGIASYVSDAPLLVAIGSLIGIVFVVSVAFGNKFANFWGALCALTFGYFSFEQGFFGNAVVQLVFILPMSIYGLYLWLKRSESEDGLKRSLTRSDTHELIAITVAFLGMALMFSLSTGATMPLFDAITTVLPVLGTFMLINAYREQWYVWWVYNGLEVIMWLVVASTAPEMLAVLVMRVVFFVNSIIGWFEWKDK